MNVSVNYSYDYRNLRVGRSPYTEHLTDIQKNYVERCADVITENLILLHRQLKSPPEWTGRSLTGWMHSAVRTKGIGIYMVEIYLKNAETHLGHTITVYVKFDQAIEVVAKAGTKHLVAVKLPFTSKPEDMSDAIVSRWKDQMTGKAKWAARSKRVPPVASHQEVVWLEGIEVENGLTSTSGQRVIEVKTKPWRVWTLYKNTSKSQKPHLPFEPKHNSNAFLEDFMNDWVWRGGKLTYFSRVVGPSEGVWLLLEYK